MVFRGNYETPKLYYKNNTVIYARDLYLCILATTGNAPSNATYWVLLVEDPDVSVANTGAGTTPKRFTLTSNGTTITLNKPI
jgi:hypothetical protein